MKKTLVTVACALTMIVAIPFAAGNTGMGLLGVDVVSAASETTGTTPTTSTTPSTTTTTTTTTPAKTTSSVSVTSVNITRNLAIGSRGDDVKVLQNKLNSNGYNLAVDGIFGPLTQAAVKNYQGKHSLVVDGIVGPQTLGSLRIVATSSTSVTSVNISRTLSVGSNGADVKVLQNALNSAGYNLVVDGIFGPLTQAAVKSYQRVHSLMVDGIVGPQTLGCLNAKAASTTPTGTTTVTPKTTKIYKGLGHTVVFRNGPGKDSTGVPVYSFTIAMADIDFDASGKIVAAYLDAYEVSTPNYDGASMPHFSGWPDMPGYNVTDHTTGQVTGQSVDTLISETAEVNGWKTKRERGDSYGMNPANEWYKQMNFYQKFFIGKTVPELQAWFAKNTTSAGRPIKATTTNQADLDKLAKLTTAEKAALADVVSGATMSLSDGHGDYMGAIADAYNNRVETVIPVK